MKPIRLEFSGINSYQSKVEIDFEVLSSRGLFGIFGRTGSGKSTILDAITLSLYGNISRGTREFINSNNDTAHLDFEFEIIEEGVRVRYRITRRYKKKTSSSKISVTNDYVRLMRRGADGEYKVISDKVKDVKSDVEGIIGLSEEDFLKSVVLPQGKFSEFLGLSGKERRNMLERIFNLDTYGSKLNERLSYRKSEVSTLIKTLEARRSEYPDVSEEALKNSVVSLEAYLKERKSIDKKLSIKNLHYKSIVALRDLYMDEESIERELVDLLSMSKDIDGYRGRIELDIRASKVIPEKDRLKSMKIVYQELKRNIDEKSLKKEEISKHISMITKDIEENKKSVDSIPYYEEVIRECRELSSILEELDSVKNKGVGDRESLDSLKSSLEKMVNEINLYKKELEEMDDKINSTQDFLKENEMSEELFSEIAEIRGLLKSEEDLIKEKKDVEISIEKYSKEMDSLIESISSLSKEEKKISELASEIVNIKSELEDVGKLGLYEEEIKSLESKAIDYQVSINSKKSEKENYLSRFSGISEDVERLEKLNEELKKLKDSISEKKYRLKSMEESRDSERLEFLSDEIKRIILENHLSKYKDFVSLEKQNLEGNDLARIKEGLCNTEDKETSPDFIKDEINCPVCNSLVSFEDISISEIRNSGDIDKNIENIKREIFDLEVNYGKKELKINDLSMSIDEKKRYKEKFDLISEELDKEKKIYIEVLDRLDKNKSLKSKNGEIKSKLAEKESEYREKKSKLEIEKVSLSKDRIALEERLDISRKRYEHILKTIESGRCRIEHIIKLYIESHGDEGLIYSDGRVDAERFIVVMDDKKARISEYKKNLSSLSKHKEELVKIILDFERKIGSKESEIVKVESTLKMYREEYKSIDKRFKSRYSNLYKFCLEKNIDDEILRSIDDIKSGRDVEYCMDIVEKKIEKINEIHNSLLEKLESMKKKENSISEEIIGHKSALDEKQKSIEHQKELVAKICGENGFKVDEELGYAVLPHEFKSELEKKIADYDGNKSKVEARKLVNKQSIERQRDAIEDYGDDMSSLSKISPIVDEEKQTIDELESILEEIKSKISREEFVIEKLKKDIDVVKDLDSKLKDVNKKMNDILNLEKVLKGNRFIEYLSKISMKSIVFDASKRLMGITNGRYSLELDSQYNFVVSDNSNGGIKRLADTMSGGEIFLTSLSLSLSLSSQIQLKGSSPLEFFFLDEGFGTLDPETLDVVMNTLERLRSSSMTIGIISHVEEMKNRMPIKLLVEFDDRESTSKVRVELS